MSDAGRRTRSMRWRLVVILAAVVAGAVGLASVGAYVATRNELRDEIDTFLARRADELTRGQRDTPQRAPGGRDGDRAQDGGGGNDAPVADEPSLPFEPDAVSQSIAVDGTVEAVSGTVELPVDDQDRVIAASGDPGRPRVRTVERRRRRLPHRHRRPGRRRRHPGRPEPGRDRGRARRPGSPPRAHRRRRHRGGGRDRLARRPPDHRTPPPPQHGGPPGRGHPGSQ